MLPLLPGLTGRGDFLKVWEMQLPSVLRRAVWAMTWAGLFLVRDARGETISAHHFGFEQEEGFAEEPWTQNTPMAGWLLMQGHAGVVSEEEERDGQWLRTTNGMAFSALRLSGPRRIGHSKTHFQMSARLCATDAADGEEFVDFDGAALGLFRLATQPDRALIHAFHVVGPTSGYWISSGVELPLDGRGRLAEWVTCSIVHDWSSGTWELRIGGETVLRGLRRAPDIEPDRFELWLFGQAAGDNEFDDVRVAPFLPEDLRNSGATASTVHEAAGGVRAGPRVVGHAQDVSHRRQADPALAESVRDGGVMALEVKLEVVGGGRHIAAVDVTSDQGKPSQIFLYSPGYDEAGNPLPLQVRIDCDAKLKQGTVLDDLRWAIVADEGEDAPASRIVRAHGSFATGPTQIATVPAEFSNKALEVIVGLLKFEKVPDR